MLRFSSASSRLQAVVCCVGASLRTSGFQLFVYISVRSGGGRQGDSSRLRTIHQRQVSPVRQFWFYCVINKTPSLWGCCCDWFSLHQAMNVAKSDIEIYCTGRSRLEQNKTQVPRWTLAIFRRLYSCQVQGGQGATAAIQKCTSVTVTGS